jgi:uncharacterized protein YycO
MKRILPIILAPALIVALGLFVGQKLRSAAQSPNKKENPATGVTNEAEIKEGDIIFQTSLSRQSQAVQQATSSPYSHCGIVYKKAENYVVYEAVGPVKFTPLAEWIARGANHHFVIKRLKNSDSILTPSAIQKMKTAGNKLLNKPYDLYFEWSDERIYCSELIWKIYHEATGIEIGQLEQLKDFNLTSKAVRDKMKERYGNKIPLEETVISPASIYNSRLLVIVKSN